MGNTQGVLKLQSIPILPSGNKKKSKFELNVIASFNYDLPMLGQYVGLTLTLTRKIKPDFSNTKKALYIYWGHLHLGIISK